MSSPTLLSPGVPTLPATTARCSSLRFTCVHVAFQSSTLPAVLELLEQRGPGPSLLFSSLAPWEGRVLLELCLAPLEPLGRWYLLLSGFLQLLTCLPFAKSDKYFQSVFLDLALVESGFVPLTLLTLNIKDPCGPTTSCWGTLYNTVSEEKLTWQVEMEEVFCLLKP